MLAAGWISSATAAQNVASANQVSRRQLNAEISDFVSKEIATHFADIKTFDPPPERVLGALTVGDFSWGSFARTLAAQAEYSGDRNIAGKDSARAIAEMGLIESRQGGKSFAQLYSTLALRHFGTDLGKNAVWQSMNDSERAEWHSLLDPTRFYDAKKRAVIDLPENYLGVAARVAAMSYKLGVLKDKAFLDSVVERASEQFVKGAIYADDTPPTGRYDRYSNEYARFCWDAAVIAGRNDIKEKLKPTLLRQMKLWWDLVSPTGYGYNWGRSQGLVSYLDTVEIAAFLGENPEFRPAPLSEIAALYNQAWLWLKADYLKDRHLFNVFGYGRGNFAYINPNREWQQTGVGLGKLIIANHSFMRAMENEGVARFPSAPTLSDVSRFEYFAKTADKVEGVWLFRKGKLRFALPITVGTVPGVADYLPAPFGLPGFAAPVEAIYPSYVPFLTLDDGSEYTAGDGSDVISPASDGRSLKITNSKWAKVGSKSGARFENGLKSEVEFRVDGGKLIRRETVTALRDINIKTWRFAFPSTASSSYRTRQNGRQIFFLNGREGKLTVTFKVIDGTKIRVVETSDGKLGKGVLGAIPIHLVAETENIKLASGQRLSWEISVEPGADARTGN
jgi:hypothetical protein